MKMTQLQLFTDSILVMFFENEKNKELFLRDAGESMRRSNCSNINNEFDKKLMKLLEI